MLLKGSLCGKLFLSPFRLSGQRAHVNPLAPWKACTTCIFKGALVPESWATHSRSLLGALRVKPQRSRDIAKVPGLRVEKGLQILRSRGPRNTKKKSPKQKEPQPRVASPPSPKSWKWSFLNDFCFLLYISHFVGAPTRVGSLVSFVFFGGGFALCARPAGAQAKVVKTCPLKRSFFDALFSFLLIFILRPAGRKEKASVSVTFVS